MSKYVFRFGQSLRMGWYLYWAEPTGRNFALVSSLNVHFLPTRHLPFLSCICRCGHMSWGHKRGHIKICTQTRWVNDYLKIDLSSLSEAPSPLAHVKQARLRVEQTITTLLEPFDVAHVSKCVVVYNQKHRRAIWARKHCSTLIFHNAQPNKPTTLSLALMLLSANWTSRTL